MSLISEWSPYDKYVQGGKVDGRYMNAAYTLLMAGPPRLSAIGGPAALGAGLAGGNAAADQIAFPIGIVQNISGGHGQQVARFFEIGSERSYFIPGRTMGQLSMSRIMYHGPSLLRTLYAYYEDLLPPTVVPSVFPNVGAGTVANRHNVKIPPGYENIYLNLASDLFKQPVGLGFLMQDSNEDSMAANYCEAVHVNNHNFGMDAGSGVIQESVGLTFERMVPIATRLVGLISGIPA